jgi:hypothetical protein
MLLLRLALFFLVIWFVRRVVLSLRPGKRAAGGLGARPRSKNPQTPAGTRMGDLTQQEISDADYEEIT